ncbi:MAG: hypothetical protein OEL76_08755 [Siculibacillus sp.]|nr:hypothetical protein [Siculibacillus sp.]
MTLFARRLALLLALPFVAVAAARAEKPYAPLAAEIGAAGTPPADLLARAKAVAEAAHAGSAEEIFAFLPDRPTVILSGITLGVPRRIEKKGPYVDATSALAAIGLSYTEGEPIAPAGKKIDMTASRVKTAMETIGDLLAAAKWGRDPLVPEAWCTARGVRWDAMAAKKAGLGGARGVYVTEPVTARPAADGASVKARLKPGFLHALDADDEDGLTAIVLPDGSIVRVPTAKVGDAMPWGLCFEKRGAAGWLLTTFVSALN